MSTINNFYLESSKINVFPAAFRDSAYQKSRFTTEENLTSLSTNTHLSHLRNYAFSYNMQVQDGDTVLNEAWVRLFIQGYRFDFKISDLEQILYQTADNVPDQFSVYAVIHLSENGHTNVGYTLAACGNSMVASAVNARHDNQNDPTSSQRTQVMTTTTDGIDSISVEHILDKYITGASLTKSFMGLCFILDDGGAEIALNQLEALGSIYSLKLNFKGNVLTNKILTLDSSNIQDDNQAGKSINEEFSTNKLILKNPSPSLSNLNLQYDGNKLVISKSSSETDRIEIPTTSPPSAASYNYVWCKRGTVDEWVNLIHVGVGNLVNNYTYTKNKYSSFASFLNHVYSSAIPYFMRATFGKSTDTYLNYRGLVPIHLSIDSLDINLPIGFTRLSNKNISGLFQYEFVKNPRNTIKATITFNINEPDNVVAEYKLSLFAESSDFLCNSLSPLPNWLIVGDIYYQDTGINVNNLISQFFDKLQDHSKIRIHLPELQTKQYFYHDARLEDVDDTFIKKRNLSMTAYNAFKTQMERSASTGYNGGTDFSSKSYNDSLLMWYDEQISAYIENTSRKHWGSTTDGISCKPLFYCFNPFESHYDGTECRHIKLKAIAESCVDIDKLDILTVSIQNNDVFLNIGSSNRTFKFNPTTALFNIEQIYLPWAFKYTRIENKALKIADWTNINYNPAENCYWSLCLQSYSDTSNDDDKLIQGYGSSDADSTIGQYFNKYFGISTCNDINFIINPNGFAANEYCQVDTTLYFNYEALNAVNHLSTSAKRGWISAKYRDSYAWLENGLFHNNSYCWEEVKYTDSSNDYSVSHGDIDIVSGSLQRYCEDLPAGTSRDFVCVSGEMDIPTSYPYFKYDEDTLFKKGSDNKYYAKYVLPFYADSTNPPQFMLPVGIALKNVVSSSDADLDEYVFGNEEFCFIDDIGGRLEGQSNKIQGHVVKSHDNTIELSLTDTRENNRWYRTCLYEKDIDKYWWGLWQLVGHVRIEVGHVPADSKYVASVAGSKLTDLGKLLWTRVRYKSHRKLFALTCICENSCISISFDGGSPASGDGGTSHNNAARIVTATNAEVLIPRWSYGMLTIGKHSPADRYLYNNLYHLPCNATLFIYPVIQNSEQSEATAIVMHDSYLKYNSKTTDDRLDKLLGSLDYEPNLVIYSTYYKYKLADGEDGGYAFQFGAKTYHYNINHTNTSMIEQSYTVRETI